MLKDWLSHENDSPVNSTDVSVDRKQKASDKDAFLFLVVVVVPCSLVDSVIKDACITHVLDDFIQSVEF